MRTLLALALLATFVVQGAQETRVPGPMHSQATAFSHERTDAWQHNGRHATPAPRPVSGPLNMVAAPARFDGWISWAELDYGDEYVATRYPRGTLVRICAVECIVRITTDFGPSAAIKPARIADVAVLDWEAICHLPRTRGVCRGTVERVTIGLPATDTLYEGGTE